MHFVVFSVHCAVCSVKCAANSVHCSMAVCSVKCCNEFSLFCLDLKLKQKTKTQMVKVSLLVEDLSVHKHPIHPDVDVRLNYKIEIQIVIPCGTG